MHGNLMNDVKVNKAELLFTLKENLKKHQQDVADAVQSRREEVFEYFKNALERMKRDETYQPKEAITFPAPKDDSADYRRAIRMAEMTVDEVIELTEDQFDKLVMDNWNWKQDFLRTTSLYSKVK